MAESQSPQAKIVLYWLEKSRSHRILWLLEELKVEYEVKTYKRTKERLAPPELKDVHPLGKSPVLSVQGTSPGAQPRVLAESAFIVEYLSEHFGKWLIPKQWPEGKEGLVGEESEEWLRYRFLMHYAEGSLMSLMILALFVGQIKNAQVPFFIKPITRGIAGKIEDGYLNRNFETHLPFLEDQLKTSGGDFFCGKELSGADIMLIFPLEVGGSRAGVTKEKYPAITAWIDRIHEREAYKRAVDRVEKETGEKFTINL